MRAISPRSLGLGVAIITIAAACSSKSAPGPVSVEPTRASSGSMLVLYKDKAFVSYKREVQFDGEGRARLSNVPVGERTEVRMTSGKVLTSEHALQPFGAMRLEALKNRRVVAITEDARLEGRVIDWNRHSITLATDKGVAVVSEPLAALEVLEVPGSMMSGELAVRGGDEGKHEVEVKTWVEGIAWRVAYTVVLDGLEADQAWLQGWLAVDSTIAQPLSVEQVAVVDGRSTKVAEDRWSQYRSYRQKVKQPKPEQPRVPIAVLGRGAKIRGGGSVRLPLFSRQRRTGVKLSRVFDPVGESFTHQGATPIFRRSYGTIRNSDSVPVSLSIQLDLPAAELSRLPAGAVSLFARVKGDVRALGATTGFGQPPSQKGDLITEEKPVEVADGTKIKAPKVRAGELRIGVAPGLTGRRWQEEFRLDKSRKRLVEELRVELKNDSPDDAIVVVHEHLYRGLNWSLAYHNEVGTAVKAAPQEVRFRVKVPANDKVLVMYRVVYTW